jgi:hypothetical protein
MQYLPIAGAVLCVLIMLAIVTLSLKVMDWEGERIHGGRP